MCSTHIQHGRTQPAAFTPQQPSKLDSLPMLAMRSGATRSSAPAFSVSSLQVVRRQRDWGDQARKQTHQLEEQQPPLESELVRALSGVWDLRHSTSHGT